MYMFYTSWYMVVMKLYDVTDLKAVRGTQKKFHKLASLVNLLQRNETEDFNVEGDDGLEVQPLL